MDQTRTVTRTDLYEKVWSTPMRKLAEEFGLSDVGLAKICRKNGIPVPGLGHWRLIETGHAPKRTPLPAIQQGQRETIAITVREPKPYDLPSKADRGPAPKISVADDREVRHPLAVRTKRAFSSASKDERGILHPKFVKAHHVSVSPSALARALRILDALFYALEERAFSIHWHKADDAALKIVVDGEDINPCLTEIISQKPHTLTPEETARRNKNQYVYAPTFDYVPTGKIRLSIADLPYELTHVRKSWSDGRRQRVEDCLGDFVAILPHIAKAIKLIKEERERERLRREEQEKRAAEERRRREEYNRKAKVVTHFLEEWQKSKAFRALADAIERNLEISTVDEQQQREIRGIAAWISRHADNIDPLTHLDWMIREFTKPSWEYW